MSRFGFPTALRSPSSLVAPGGTSIRNCVRRRTPPPPPAAPMTSRAEAPLATVTVSPGQALTPTRTGTLSVLRLTIAAQYVPGRSGGFVDGEILTDSAPGPTRSELHNAFVAPDESQVTREPCAMRRSISFSPHRPPQAPKVTSSSPAGSENRYCVIASRPLAPPRRASAAP